MEVGLSGIMLLKDLEVHLLGVHMLLVGSSARMVCKFVNMLTSTTQQQLAWFMVHILHGKTG